MTPAPGGEEPFAGRKNYSGFEASINFSWIFGRGF